MQKEEFISLVDKYLVDNCSPEEQQLIYDYCEKIQMVGTPPRWELDEEEETKIRLLSTINNGIDQLESKSRPIPRSKVQPSGWHVAWRVAAILVMVSGILAWFISSGTSEEPAQQIELITKETDRGQKASIKLPDGSVVRLNAESSIQYASDFSISSTRNVALTGEAYFDVVEDKAKPFVVETDHINTIVVGTTFNINSYTELPQISVTLETGKVKVATNNEEGIIRSLEMVPGQQITFNRVSREMHKKSVNLKKFLAWKDGEIILEGDRMRAVAALLEKWYNVSFQFQNENLKQCSIHGEFKSDNLQNILKNIEFLTGLEFQLKNGVVQVSGEGCN